MTRELLIHAGGGKTGSCALQSFFALNADLLATHGIDYPDEGNNAYAAGGGETAGNSHLAAVDLLQHGIQLDPEASPGHFRNLLDRVAASQAPRVLISSETWDAIPAGFLARMIELFAERDTTVTFISYVRSLAEQLVSAWLQLVRMGVCLDDFHTFCENASTASFGYALSRKFPDLPTDHGTRLLVKSYDHCRSRLCADFTEDVLGIDAGACQFHEKEVNLSLGWPEADLVRSSNILTGRQPPGEAFARRVMAASTGRKPPPPVIAPETLAVIEARFGDRVAAVNELLPDSPISLLGNITCRELTAEETPISTATAVDRHRPAVIYLARPANDFEPIERFFASYRKQPAGIGHDLIVVCKTDDPRAIDRVKHICGDLEHTLVQTADVGYDIGSYQNAVRQIPNRWVCCLNTGSEILVPDWLEKLYGWGVLPDVGVVGATGSYESLNNSRRLITEMQWRYRNQTADSTAVERFFSFALPELHGPAGGKNQPLFGRRGRLAMLYKRTKQALRRRAGVHWSWTTARTIREAAAFPPFPNPHIRSNAFFTDRRHLLAAVPGAIASKHAAYLFESGPESLSARVRQAGLKTLVIDRDGKAHEPEAWPEAGTFRSRNQEALLIADGQTRRYGLLSAAEQITHRLMTWGLGRVGLPSGFPLTEISFTTEERRAA